MRVHIEDAASTDIDLELNQDMRVTLFPPEHFPIEQKAKRTSGLQVYVRREGSGWQVKLLMTLLMTL